MRLNRYLCFGAIIGSGIFVSYYGGTISYALFYLSLLVPAAALLYTIYVYLGFKIHQSMEGMLVVKGDWNPYSFVIANENYMAFRNVRVKFLADKSIIEEGNQAVEYSLIPGEKAILNTRIKCNYRGEYYVGVDSIVITDFLYLFSITYPLKSKLKTVVLPRIVELERLGIEHLQIDVKNPLISSSQDGEELDNELRKYYPGDTRKRIHWKASAKLNELMSRKYHHKPKTEIVLFMDLIPIHEEEIQVVVIEDKIIESIIGIANYYMQSGTGTQIIYEDDKLREVTIFSPREFDVFYKACAKLKFQAEHHIHHLMLEKFHRGGTGDFYVAATHAITKELYLTSLQIMAAGNPVCILYAGDNTAEEMGSIIQELRSAGADVYQLTSEDEINEVLR